MTRPLHTLVLLLVLLLVSGCSIVDFDGGFDDDVEGIVPRIDSFTPKGAYPVLRNGDPPMEFIISGTDDDSFEVDLSWYVGDNLWADDTASSDDGSFGSNFSLSYEDAAAEGYEPVEVRFEVTDPDGLSAENFWWVELDDTAR